jgi:hypothetical protein
MRERDLDTLRVERLLEPSPVFTSDLPLFERLSS